MVLKLPVYIRNAIFFSHKPKTGEIPKFRTFLAKFSILAYISLKIGNFELGHDYDNTMTSYLRRWYLFWYLWKKKTSSYTIAPITCIWGLHLQVHRGGNHPLVNCVTEKVWWDRVNLQAEAFCFVLFCFKPKQES